MDCGSHVDQGYCLGCMRKRTQGTTKCPVCGYQYGQVSPSFALQPGTNLANGRYLVGKVLKRGDFGISFFSGEFADNCITIQVRPVDTTAGEAVTYRFTWDGADWKGNPTYKMEPGKYYVLHPDVVTELEGLFALEFAEWSCGME